MKKITIITLLSSIWLIAGGDVAPSPVVPIPTTSCKDERIYIENDAKLIWQDQFYTTKEEGAYKNERSFGKAGNLNHAMRYCSTLHYAGYSDWRVPTADELKHIHDKNNHPFVYNTDSDFWTSTPTTENRYLVVFPADAQQYARSVKQSNYIRCVRCFTKDVEYRGSIIVK